MKILEKILHWAFAAFFAIVSYFASMFAMAVLLLKMIGLEIGVAPPADFQPRVGSAVLGAAATCMFLLPAMVAAFLGAITAPNSQRLAALAVFPVSVWVGLNLMMHSGRPAGGVDPRFLLESGASCAFVGIVLYLGWRRRHGTTAPAA